MPGKPRRSKNRTSADEVERVLELNRKAANAIWELWLISSRPSGNAKEEDDQSRLAARCLKVLEAFAHDPGRRKRKPGDLASAKENRNMLTAFAMLAEGAKMTDIAMALKSGEAHDRVIRRYSVLLKRFSVRVYTAVRAKYPRWGDGSLRRLSGAYVVSAVEDWSGVTSADAPALTKALQFYFSKHPELTKQQRLEADVEKRFTRSAAGKSKVY